MIIMIIEYINVKSQIVNRGRFDWMRAIWQDEVLIEISQMDYIMLQFDLNYSQRKALARDLPQQLQWASPM